jgi:peptidoglycan/xylan/chitin deacetylase (PgdA/CDA1 family)
MNELTITMYHYVRDFSRSRFPRIKGRSLSEFREQLDFISSRYVVVTVAEVIAASRGEAQLPPNAIWLTFDDGYLDHYLNVFPLLLERGWQGSFFPPARAVLEGALLDVNKIHYILAQRDRPDDILEELRLVVGRLSTEGKLMPFDRYWQELGVSTRFDTAEIAFIKRMLQHAVPEDLRTELIDHLFAKFVSSDAPAIAAELYMSTDQLRAMQRCGMHIGSHGYNHCWLDKLSPVQQQHEIDLSLGFLDDLGVPTNQWVMSYPYGAFDNSLLELLTARGCALGVTTAVRIARVGDEPPLLLPRLDTNDLPPSPQSLSMQ